VSAAVRARVLQTYQVAYVIVKAANAPRPGQWLLERSVDGVRYSVWQYFAMTDGDCWNVFGVEPTRGVPRFATDDEVHCSSAFSHLDPLENGEASRNSTGVLSFACNVYMLQ